MSGYGVTRIYLVRHGETDWNRARRLQGLIDTPLNPIGRHQARRLAGWFGRHPISHVMTSPLTRARHTAIAIARSRTCGFGIDQALIELDHGSWAGRTLMDIAHTFPDAVIEGQLHAESVDASGGESIDVAYARASRVLRRLLAVSPGGSMVVVGHGITNALLICVATGQPSRQFDAYRQPNGWVDLLCFRRGGLVSLASRLLIGLAQDDDNCHPFPRSASQ
jgi:broad specificity phosphatase PhoE